MPRKFVRMLPTLANVDLVRRISRHLTRSADSDDADTAESDAMLALSRGRLAKDRPLLWAQLRNLRIDGWRHRYGRTGQRTTSLYNDAMEQTDTAAPVDARSELADDVDDYWRTVDPLLTPWEREAARKLADGWSQVDLARHFGVSEATISGRVKKIRAILARRGPR